MKNAPRQMPVQSTVKMRVYKAILGTLVWSALILQLYLIINVSIERGSGLWVGIARYFGYFTILTNILVALVLTVPLVRPRTRWGQFFSQPNVMNATAAYIIMVAIPYSLFLRHAWKTQGWQVVVDEILHDVSPILYTVFWILFVPKAALQWRNLPAWLIYPLAYLIVTLISGAIFKWYPYPFLEVDKLGYPQVFLNTAMLFFGSCIVSAALIGIARLGNVLNLWRDS